MANRIFQFVYILIIVLCAVGCDRNKITDDEINLPLQPPADTIISHPRLLLKQGEEQKIKTLLLNNPQLAPVHQFIIDYADKTITLLPLEHELIGKRLLATSNEALKRIYFLSYAYRMTGDAKYLSRAETELLAVCNFQDWNPTHFLDVAEMTMAVAIGYDWLYGKLSETVRAKLKKAIVDKGLMQAKNEKNAWFYTATNNWNQVCNAGLVLGALAIYEDEPIMAKEMINKSVKSVPSAMASYGPDGAYPEGFSYWGYGTGFEVTMLAALESALGTDYKLSENISFMRSPYFMLMMTAPSGLCYNYGDAGSKPAFQHAMYWFAAKLKDASLLYHDQKYLTNLASYTGSANDRLLPNVLIFSKDVSVKTAETPKMNFWLSAGIKPLFIYRSGFNDKNDAYLGVVGGAANVSHGHMDAGSFVYEKNGVRWALELGLQSYYTLESKGVDLWNNNQDGQRWAVFRLGNTGHSTLVMNGERHIVNGNPIITNTFQTDTCKGAELDLSSLFINSVKKVIRKVSLDVDNNLHIVDQIPTKEISAKIMWIMVAPEGATIVNTNQIELTKDGKKMLLTVESPALVTMKIWNNKPVNSYDQDNPGTIRVGFETTIAANTTEAKLIISLKEKTNMKSAGARL